MRLARLTVIASALASLSWPQQPTAAPAPAGTAVPAPTVAGAPARRGRGPAAPTGPLPRLADGKPDLSGVWNGSTGDLSKSLLPGEEIALTPAAQKIMKARLSKDDPEANCLPGGVPRMAPYPWRIVQIPNYIFLLYEANIHSYRQIFLDGRKHNVLWNTWYGDSIGTWDGDTLVVDTIGFNDRFWFDAIGHPHTEQLHTVERFIRKDFGTLVIETTIIDPGAYVKPFRISMTARLGPKDDLMEYICAENNQDLSHIQSDHADR